MVLTLGTLRKVDQKCFENYEMCGWKSVAGKMWLEKCGRKSVAGKVWLEKCGWERMEISWTDRVRNEEVLYSVKEMNIVNTVKGRQEGSMLDCRTGSLHLGPCRRALCVPQWNSFLPSSPEALRTYRRGSNRRTREPDASTLTTRPPKPSRKGNCNGYILRRNCLLKQLIEGKIEVKGRRRRRSKQLMNDVKEKRGYRKLKEEELDRTL
jgi:hypothetical protein